jgi:hypothetical protein
MHTMYTKLIIDIHLKNSFHVTTVEIQRSNQLLQRCKLTRSRNAHKNIKHTLFFKENNDN